MHAFESVTEPGATSVAARPSKKKASENQTFEKLTRQRGVATC